MATPPSTPAGPTTKHPGWANHLQFMITRNAKGNDLRIRAVFAGETGYGFTGNFSSWSYDGNEWQRGYWVTESEYQAANPDEWEPEEGWDDGWEEDAGQPDDAVHAQVPLAIPVVPDDVAAEDTGI